MEITMIKNNTTGYDIRYFVDPASDYLKYLPALQQMINSLQIVGLGELKPTAIQQK